MARVAVIAEPRVWPAWSAAAVLVVGAVAVALFANLLPVALFAVPALCAVPLIARAGFRWRVSVALALIILGPALAVEAFLWAYAPASKVVPWSVVGVLLASLAGGLVLLLWRDDIARRLPETFLGERTAMRLEGDAIYARSDDANELVDAINAGELDPSEARTKALRWAEAAGARAARRGLWQPAHAAEAAWLYALAEFVSDPSEHGAQRADDLARISQDVRRECVRRAREVDPLLFELRSHHR